MEVLKKIGVVTVTYNSKFVIGDFMESVLKQNYTNWILYVIDNDSKDGTLDYFDLYQSSQIKLISNKKNYGVAKGNNQGINEALADECDYVLLLNNDTVFDENLFHVLLRDLTNNNADMISPKMMYFNPSDTIWCAGGSFSGKLLIRNNHHGENQRDTGQFNAIYQCDYVPTCCVLIKISLFKNDSVGLMDEKYFVYYDDTDWMWRAKIANRRLVYTPNVLLYHKVSSLTGGGESRFSVEIITRNRVYFIRKNFKFFPKLLFLSTYFFGILFGTLTGRYSYKVCKLKLISYYAGLIIK